VRACIVFAGRASGAVITALPGHEAEIQLLDPHHTCPELALFGTQKGKT
jgi:hypothetical protein